QPPGAAGHAGLLRWAPAWGAERLVPGARAAGGPHAAMGPAADRADSLQPAPPAAVVRSLAAVSLFAARRRAAGRRCCRRGAESGVGPLPLGGRLVRGAG